MLIPLDTRNPLDFLAGCGVLELAIRHTLPATACWSADGLLLTGITPESLADWWQRLAACKACPDSEAALPVNEKFAPMSLSGLFEADWPFNVWLDAGQQNKTLFAGGVAGQVAMDSIVTSNLDALAALLPQAIAAPAQVLQLCAKDGKLQVSKLDARNTWDALANGFSLNDTRLNALLAVRPFAEILALIGAQGFFPQALPTRGHDFDYHIWHHPLPLLLAKAAVRGVPLGISLHRCHAPARQSGKLVGYAYSLPCPEELNTWTFSN